MRKWDGNGRQARWRYPIASVRELYVLSFSDAGYLLDSCCVHGVCVCVCVPITVMAISQLPSGHCTQPCSVLLKL